MALHSLKVKNTNSDRGSPAKRPPTEASLVGMSYAAIFSSVSIHAAPRHKEGLDERNLLVSGTSFPKSHILTSWYLETLPRGAHTNLILVNLLIL